jgi:serine/threonine protein kinase
MTDDGHAQLADLGLAIVSEGTGADMTATSTNAGSAVWMSPQRIVIPNHRRNMPDDVYAYGCLIYLVQSLYRSLVHHVLIAAAAIHEPSHFPWPKPAGRHDHDHSWRTPSSTPGTEGHSVL